MSTTDTGSSQGLTDQVREGAGQMMHAAGEKAGSVKEQGLERMRTEVDSRSTQVGGQTRTLAQALRRTGDDLRAEGNGSVAGLTTGAADRLEHLAGYLEQMDGSRLLHDVENAARRRPWLVAAGGALLGLAASRFLKASSEQRYGRSQGMSSDWQQPSWEETTRYERPVPAMSSAGAPGHGV